MADAMQDVLIPPPDIEEKTITISESECKYCLKYKQELEKVFQELNSVKKIIQLLQEDANLSNGCSTVSTNNTTEIRDMNPSLLENKSDEWLTVTTNKKRNLQVNKTANLDQHFQIPTCINRYAVLDNLENKSGLPQEHSKIINTISNNSRFGHSVKPKKKKVIMIGDSHMRGHAKELSDYLGKDFEVSGTVMPGSRLDKITLLAKNEINALTKEDVVIIWGGSNDINKNETSVGLKHLNKFVSHRKNTNVLVLPAPHRHDLLPSSCINNEVQTFNRKLCKSMKTKENVHLLELNLHRNDFTQHGLHLNISGKVNTAELIGENIKQLFYTPKKTPITLDWITEQTVRTQEAEKDSQDIQDASLLCERNTRTSSRPKRYPVTRNEDFLWTKV